MVPSLITVEAFLPPTSYSAESAPAVGVRGYSQTGEETVLQIITNIIAEKKRGEKTPRSRTSLSLSIHTLQTCAKRTKSRKGHTYVRVALQEIRQTATFGARENVCALFVSFHTLSEFVCCVSHPTVTPHVCMFWCDGLFPPLGSGFVELSDTGGL